MAYLEDRVAALETQVQGLLATIAQLSKPGAAPSGLVAHYHKYSQPADIVQQLRLQANTEGTYEL